MDAGKHARWMALLALAAISALMAYAVFGKLWEKHGVAERVNFSTEHAQHAINTLCKDSLGQSTLHIDLGALDTNHSPADASAAVSQAEERMVADVARESVCRSAKPAAASDSDFSGFTRFLLFVSDCWPATYAQDIFDHYSERGMLYRIGIPGAKHSAAIFTSYLTGLPPSVNSAGQRVTSDTWLASLRRNVADHKVAYMGPGDGALLKILGGPDSSEKFFDSVDIQAEGDEVSHMHAWPYLFEQPTYMSSTINQLIDNSRSLVAFSEVLDKRQHAESRGYTSGNNVRMSNMGAERVSYAMNTDIKNLKPFLDAHPEYALILISDHGVDQFDHQGFRLHGDAADGNEPFLFFYGRRFPPNPPGTAGEWIRAQDVAPTLATLLQGADIPADAQGYSHAHFGPNATRPRLAALRQSVVQLSQLAVRRGIPFSRKIIASALTTTRTDGSIEKELVAAAEHILSRIEESVLFPFFQFVAVSLGLVTCLYFVSTRYNPRLFDMLLHDVLRDLGLQKSDTRDTFLDHFHDTPLSKILKLAAIYSLPAAQLLFWWDAWGATNLNGAVYRIISPVLVLIIFRTLRSVDVANCVSEVADSTSQDSNDIGQRNNGAKDVQRAAQLVDVCKGLLARNEFINLMLVFMATCFPEVLASFDDGIPFSYGMSFLLAVWLFWRHALYFRVSRGSDASPVLPPFDSTRSMILHRLRIFLGVAVFNRSRWVARLSFALGILATHVYFRTQSDEWWFWSVTGGMHGCLSLVLVGCGIVAPLVLLLLSARNRSLGSEATARTRRDEFDGDDAATLFDVLLPWAAVLYLLSTPYRRFIVLLFVYQLYMMVAPAAECVRQLLSAHRHGTHHSLSPDQQSRSALMMVLQCLTVYSINQAFVTFTFGFGDRLNFDLHPYAGKFGLPGAAALEQQARVDTVWSSRLSFAMMLLHKFGPFVLSAAFTAALTQLHAHPDPVSKHAEPLLDRFGQPVRLPGVAAIAESLERAKHTSMLFADHASALFLLMELTCGIGCLAMITFGVADKLLFEQAAATLIVCGAIASMNLLLRSLFEVLVALPRLTSALSAAWVKRSKIPRRQV